MLLITLCAATGRCTQRFELCEALIGRHDVASPRILIQGSQPCKKYSRQFIVDTLMRWKLRVLALCSEAVCEKLMWGFGSALHFGVCLMPSLKTNEQASQVNRYLIPSLYPAAAFSITYGFVSLSSFIISVAPRCMQHTG